jgi:heme/copper-type cytochrome/quinol oxidase subunit 2
MHATDNIHGFWLEGYNIKQLMCEDHAFTLSFITNKAGTFLFRCSEPACGPYHPYMSGQFRVEPAPLDLLPAVTILSSLLIGIIVFVRTRL